MSLLVGGIAVMLVIVIFLNFQKINLAFQKRITGKSEMIIDYERLRKDFNRAKEVLLIDDILYFSRDDGSNKRYEVEENSIIDLNANDTDTLRFRTGQFEFEFLEPGNYLLSSLSFVLYVEEKSLPVYLYKDYPAAILVNNELNASYD
ncbi:MAG: hypothetical protein K9H62_24215 [Bacteroidales bacterium]|nr:hypothetical protein [Bacteroidales bacterium]